MAYLIHFNRNHSSKTGRFIPGDGDGDGIVNDHKNQKSSDNEKSSTSSGGGAITLNEDDEEEDDEEKQAAEEKKIRAENLKELARREKMKNNKKKSSKKKGSKSGSKKKKKQKIVANKIASVQEIANKSVNDLPSVDDIKNKYPDLDLTSLTKESKPDDETISILYKILSVSHSSVARSN